MLCRHTVLKLDSQLLRQAISNVMAEVQTVGIDFVFASAMMSVIALTHREGQLQRSCLTANELEGMILFLLHLWSTCHHQVMAVASKSTRCKALCCVGTCLWGHSLNFEISLLMLWLSVGPLLAPRTSNDWLIDWLTTPAQTWSYAITIKLELHMCPILMVCYLLDMLRLQTQSEFTFLLLMSQLTALSAYYPEHVTNLTDQEKGPFLQN